MNKNDFEFKYSAPSSEERKEIESIKKSYLPKTDEENKLELLRKLDYKVKSIPVLFSLVLGIIGALIFGLGMAMILEWNIILWGVLVCSLGVFPMSFAYPLNLKLSKKMTDKYAQKIINLSDELLNDGQD